MAEKYVVRLTDNERTMLSEVVKSLRGASEKARRAYILLKADADGPNWTNEAIGEAISCRERTINNVRRRFVTEGLDETLNRRKPEKPPRPKKLDGKQEAQIIALRLGEPPAGFGNWSLRLLAEKVVELEIVESISHETLRATLKKMG
jgi:transposase